MIVEEVPVFTPDEEEAIKEVEATVSVPQVEETIKQEPVIVNPKRTRTKKGKVEQIDMAPVENVVQEAVEVPPSNPVMDENMLTMYLLSQATAKKQLKQEKYRRLMTSAF